jgi:hypothetical protein
MNWRDLLQLEGDENVNVQVNSLDPYEMLYWESNRLLYTRRNIISYINRLL